MKRYCSGILLSAALVFTLTGCGYAGPEKAVRQELDLIRQLDESTIKAFVSYEQLQLDQGTASEIGPETIDAVKLFFKNFDYKIRSSSLSDDEKSAAVTVDITNLDAHALAKDLCRIMITESWNTKDKTNTSGLAYAFSIMKECLEKNTYETTTTTANVSLIQKGDQWLIQESVQLEDQLAGGLASYLADPYLLSPEEVLVITLDSFSEFTKEDWLTYLNIQDIFSLNTDLSSEIDQLLAEQIATFFDYNILDVAQDGDSAIATVEITSLDLESVINHCRTELLDYAQTTESIRASDSELAQKTAQLILEALQTNTATVTNTLELPMFNNGFTWEEIPVEGFTDAVLGGVSDAVALLYAE